jgi:hypothetical protein
MTFRGIKPIWIVKGAWLGCVISILLTSFGTCFLQPECTMARNELLPFLYAFSFPGSLLFVIFNDVLIDFGFVVDAAPPLHYLYLALGSILVGYIQWFHMIPALFSANKLTSLSLHQSEKLLVAETVPPTEEKPIANKTRLEIAPFDEFGRTPFERVLVAQDHR